MSTAYPTVTLPETLTMAPSRSESRFWIKASPRGTRSGFAVLPDGANGRVTVTVLPKPWSARAGAVREYVHTPGTTTHVVMYETELAVLSTTASSVGAFAVSVADISRDQADLLMLGAPPRDPATPMAISGDPFGDLVDLMLLAQRGKLSSSSLNFEGSFAPSLLRMLSHARLVKVVEGLIFRARPRYVERIEALEMPRGRLQERSLLLSRTTGVPRVESAFDELAMDTPLLQVVVSALRVVASERLPRQMVALHPGLQARSVQLLRYLAGVSRLDRERALLAAERLWLSPLDRDWAPAIDAAVQVLRDRAVVPHDGTATSEAILVHLSTEKFWEQCLELVLKSAFKTVAVSREARPGEGMSVPAPWAPRTPIRAEPVELRTETLPDFMFHIGSRAVVADAKYKLSGDRAPSSADGYQLFAYSHLATLNGNPTDLSVLFYPMRGGGQPSQLQLDRLRDRGYALWLVRLPFPTREDLQSQANWSGFIARVARVIRDFSTGWLARSR